MNKYRNILSATKKYLIKSGKIIFPGKDWDEINAVLVVSTGRTGTKFIASYFNKYIDDFFAIHEPFPKIDLISSKYFAGKMSYHCAKKKIHWRRQFMQRELYKVNHNNYLESNPALWSLIPIMREIIPNVKIIHIIRDGRTWLRSGYSRKFDGKGNLIKDRHGIFWKFTSDDFPHDEYYGHWSYMNMIEKLSWIWKIKNETILNDIKSDSDAITVKFEDIFNEENDCKGIQSIVDFISKDYPLNLNVDDMVAPLKNKINRTSGFQLPEYTRWTVNQKKSFEGIAGNLMHQLGYN